ncbi:MAG: ankyrin repeat domain-containing protein [Gemmataceae bacterium]|nr:ankyrin repeat domain-containing protein [Gemmataceae bacterium]
MGTTVGNRKADALLKAAQSGAVAKLRELLAAGAPVEATDVNRMTPVMLAAQGGHLEAFRLLVEAGADLHATAFRQLDLLEVAAGSGNVEIVRFLLERGLPVNGHWQPVNEAVRKIGHDTPLIQAAAEGHVELVRILLEAGADQNAKYRGKTALEQVREILRDPDAADQKQQYP